MGNTDLVDRIWHLQSRKEALQMELKLVVDELAECEGRLKAEQERAAAVEAACRANKFLYDRRTRRFNDRPGLNRFLMCSADNGLNAKLFQPYRLFHLGALQAEFGEYLKTEFGARNAAASVAR